LVPSGTAQDQANLLRRVHEHTPTDVRAIDLGGAGDLGTGATIEEAIAGAAPADVVILSADCAVAAGWLDGLRDAAYADSTVASASPLIIDAESDGTGFDAAAAAIRASSLRVRPRLAAAGQKCLYLRRSALELGGAFDGDFSQRCLDMGLCHLGADEVLVGLPSPDAVEPRFESRVSRDLSGTGNGPLERSLGVARRALGPPSVMIDVRAITGPVNGTQLHVLELLAAVARTGRVAVRALLPDKLSEHGRSVIDALPGVEPVTAADAQSASRADIVHRPFQISAPAELSMLAGLADRLVITQQDMLNYHNPSYFGSTTAWEGHRRLTERALATADGVLFLSRHARDDAVALELVAPERASVILIGVDHRMAPGEPEPAPPAGVESLAAGREAMLCIGTDFRHKNRVFALHVVSELQRRHGWDGLLAFAGSHVRHGSSAEEERRLLGTDEQLRDAVVDLGAVSEAEKAWLLDHAKLVVYPSIHEGFGLIPFEAFHHGVPCLWAAGTSLSEILPDAAARIVPWDAAASADGALALIRDERARAENLRALGEAAQALRWDLAGDRLIDLYLATCAQPRSPASSYERREGLMQPGFSEDAVRLVGPGGLLPRELERPLLALASHPRLGGPVFRAIGTAYRASRRRRRS
jgi:glycosyltransferase involved in cell wall biosynthesis